MPHATCSHCQVTISDHSTMVEQDGRTYCCKNCAQTAGGPQERVAGGATCAHCGVTIHDAPTQVERDGRTFCCNNCATAMV
jgi:hypothetical protein